MGLELGVGMFSDMSAKCLAKKSPLAGLSALMFPRSNAQKQGIVGMREER